MAPQNSGESIIDKVVNDQVEKGDWLSIVCRFLRREDPYLSTAIAEVARGNDLKLIREVS